jgi:hypothetical protein
LSLIGLATALYAQSESGWQVKPEWVKAHEEFLASDILQGRASATRDEGIAATYAGSQFEAYGLQPAPGTSRFVQPVEVEQPQLDGRATLSSSGGTLREHENFYILSTWGTGITAPLQKIALADWKSAKVQPGAALLIIGTAALADLIPAYSALSQQGAQILLSEDSPAIQELFQRQYGGQTRIRLRVKGAAEPALGRNVTWIALQGDAAARLAQLNEGQPITLALNLRQTPARYAYNALGYLAGSDPSAGTLLISAHLDHVGVGRPFQGDSIYNGADDDASGTTAVLELAHALAAGSRPKRSILFVCFGAEEVGGLGADYFREHPPIALTDIIANVEFEMIGIQDPKLPPHTMMLTGWDRSDLGPVLNEHGAHLAADAYPEQNFFQRSDNYALAVRGVVAQTASGMPVPPFYHRPDDDLSHLDFGFMTAAIQSMVEPLRWLANSDFRPHWNPGKEPK